LKVSTILLIKKNVSILQTARTLKSYLYAGNAVHCPICDRKFRHFLPYGVIKRPNAKCPNCLSLERHRLLWLYLTQQTAIFAPVSAPLKVLHVAPEAALFGKFRAAKTIEYFPTDKFEEGYDHAYPEGTTNMDVTDIPFADNTFDVIICNHVLEHVPDDALAMRELHRVLKPAGFAILQSPMETDRPTTYEDFSLTTPAQKLAAFGQYDHVRIYGADYGTRLTAAGFEVQIDTFNAQFSAADRFKFGLPPYEDIYLCKK
jgi:SAM-dependent methyltransferase